MIVTKTDKLTNIFGKMFIDVDKQFLQIDDSIVTDCKNFLDSIFECSKQFLCQLIQQSNTIFRQLGIKQYN